MLGRQTRHAVELSHLLSDDFELRKHNRCRAGWHAQRRAFGSVHPTEAGLVLFPPAVTEEPRLLGERVVIGNKAAPTSDPRVFSESKEKPAA